MVRFDCLLELMDYLLINLLGTPIWSQIKITHETNLCVAFEVVNLPHSNKCSERLIITIVNRQS